MKLSIVATLYQSDPYIAEFHRRSCTVAQTLVGDDYEVILVNDGSPDHSLETAVQLSETDHHVVVVDLSRNFGHHNAMMTGLEQAVGEQIFLVDSDLEEDPEWMLSFSAQLKAEKADVVYGVQETRKGGWFERWSGAAFYTLFNWLSDIDHPRNVLTARLMSRRYVDALLTHREREMVISCLWVITGFKQSSQAVKKHMSSATTYSFIKKLNHLVNAITSFSAAPLQMIFVCGILVFIGAILYAMFLIVMRLFMAQPVDGYTSIMVSIWVLGGMIISFLGIIGIYLSKVFTETKQRPSAIIRDIYGRSK